MEIVWHSVTVVGSGGKEERDRAREDKGPPGNHASQNKASMFALRGQEILEF